MWFVCRLDLHTFPSLIRRFSPPHFDSKESLFIHQSLSRRGDVTHALELCLLQQGQPTNTTTESSLRTTFSGSYYAKNEAERWWNKQHTIARWLSKRKGKKVLHYCLVHRTPHVTRAARKKATSSEQQHKPEGRWIRSLDANSTNDRAINDEFPTQRSRHRRRNRWGSIGVKYLLAEGEPLSAFFSCFCFRLCVWNAFQVVHRSLNRP